MLKEDILALCFAMETVCHLNPTRMGGTTVRAYLDCAERVREGVRRLDVAGALVGVGVGERRVEGIPAGTVVQWDVGQGGVQSAVVAGGDSTKTLVQMDAGQYDPDRYPDGLRWIDNNHLRVVK